MANFLEALGDTLLTGSALAGRARADARQKMLDDQATKRHALELALMERGADREAGLDILSAGPGAKVSPEQAAVVEKAGFGNRLAPFMQDIRELDPNVVVPIQVKGEGQQILPSFDQQRLIQADQRATEMHGFQVGDYKAQAAERTKQQGLRELISTPEYWNQPVEKRQVIWSQAGYSGQAPLSWDTMRERMDYEHKLEMEKVNAQIQGQKDVAGIRGTMTPNQVFDNSFQLKTALAKETAFATKMKNQLGLMRQGMQAVLEGKGAPGSQAILVTFQKILDPESVVRESEYARSQVGQSLVNALKGRWETIKDGGANVSKEALQEYVALAERFVAEQEAYVQQKYNAAGAWADHFGLPRNLIVPGTVPSQPGPIPTNPPPGNTSPGATTSTTPGRFTLLPPGS